MLQDWVAEQAESTTTTQAGVAGVTLVGAAAWTRRSQRDVAVFATGEFFALGGQHL